MPHLAVFPTDLGWCGLVGSDGAILHLVIGHASSDDVRRAVQPSALGATELDWDCSLRQRLVRYARGERIDFADCTLAPRPLTAFQQRVVLAARSIPYGERVSYAELARRAGRPGAARAVGNVMASNRVPIIVPCHRVVASGGRLGGFSAPQGTLLKQRMLQMEAGS